MPLVDFPCGAEWLVILANVHRICNECRARTAIDYCQDCDELYWLHREGCVMYEDKHYGHRLTIVPYVQVRWEGCTLKHDGPCNPCCNPLDY